VRVGLQHLQALKVVEVALEEVMAVLVLVAQVAVEPLMVAVLKAEQLAALEAQFELFGPAMIASFHQLTLGTYDGIFYSC
jgi:hypothetical protein